MFVYYHKGGYAKIIDAIRNLLYQHRDNVISNIGEHKYESDQDNKDKHEQQPDIDILEE